MILVKLLVVIVLLLVLISRKVHMALSLLIASAALLLICRQPPALFLEAVATTARDPVTYTMALTILFIGMLGALMDRFGMLTRMVGHLERLVRSAKVTIMLAPTVIGLLLVTGGALMSCPLVNELGERLKLPGDKRAAINMIFRHGLYFVYPLSPTMIMASQLGGFTMWQFIRLMLPLTLLIYALGWLFYLRGVADVKTPALTGKEFLHHLGQFLIYASPILISILVTAIFGIEFYMSLPVGIVCAMVIYLADVKKGRAQKLEMPLSRVLLKSVNINLVLIILAVLLFKNTIGSVSEINEYIVGLVASGIPLELVILTVCLLITFPTGNFQPSMAVAYPLILPVATGMNQVLLYSYILYCVGFMCYYASPVHMCQVLSCEYFGIKPGALYKAYRVFLPVLALFMILWYFALRFTVLA